MRIYKIMKNGNSFYCNLPPEYLKYLKLEKGDIVDVSMNEATNEITIKKIKVVI